MFDTFRIHTNTVCAYLSDKVVKDWNILYEYILWVFYTTVHNSLYYREFDVLMPHLCIFSLEPLRQDTNIHQRNYL